jgi:hypothetical protein
MDFEDGISLSKMLKQGRRFNERSLWNILRPIAEGLEMAHRVGVLHRDIKPPNILISEDNRPVLIDFGSARFEAAEATSTSVTFHTPPYAAIEQYVKTYPQGPWTDIYALGVVMYECITGEKPPEVLERLHAGLGQPLAEGKWPGYSKRFLAAIDEAMRVKPDERPQLLSDWLAMFGKAQGDAPESDEATRFFAKQVETQTIVPVPPTPAVKRKAAVETRVPADPKEAEFKRAGEETAAARKLKSEQELAKEAAPAPGKKAVAGAVAETPAEAAPGKTAGKDGAAPEKKTPNVAVLAGVAGALILVAGVGAITLRGGGQETEGPQTQSLAEATAGTIDLSADGLANATDLNAIAAETQDPALTEGEVSDDASSTALRREAQRAAAAEARLKAMERAAAKSRAKTAVAGEGPQKKAEKATAASASTPTESASGSGVSAAQRSQFYSTVDEGRRMAKKVMRSQSGQNAQLARSYDNYLKSLRPSIRGAKTAGEADALIKQARLYRAYIQTLEQ